MKIFDGRLPAELLLSPGGASGLGRDVARRIVAEGDASRFWISTPISLPTRRTRLARAMWPLSTSSTIARSQRRLCRHTTRSAGSTCW